MRLVAPSVLALSALSVGGCLVQPRGADCSGPAACDGCIDRSGCGWCVSDERCVEGTSLGPATGSCARPAWRFDSCNAPPGGGSGCGDNGYCSTCIGDGCRWCVGAETCVSEGASCGGGSVTEGGDCAAAGCAAHDDCGSCHAAGCTWCATADGACIDAVGGCASEDRYHSRDGCPPAGGCNATTCNDCASVAGCVWCFEGEYGCRPEDRNSGCDRWYSDPFGCS